MSDLKETLLKSEMQYGLTGISSCYNDMDEDIRNFFDSMWPIMVSNVKLTLASDLCEDLISKNKYLQYIYLSLKVKYMDYFLAYPEAADLNFTLNYENSKLDYNMAVKLIESGAELYLYLNTFALAGCSGKNIKIPFVLGIKYNDKLNDNSIILKNYKGIILCEMSKIAVKNEVKSGFKFIDDQIDKFLNKINEGIIRQN